MILTKHQELETPIDVTRNLADLYVEAVVKWEQTGSEYFDQLGTLSRIQTRARALAAKAAAADTAATKLLRLNAETYAADTIEETFEVEAPCPRCQGKDAETNIAMRKEIQELQAKVVDQNTRLRLAEEASQLEGEQERAHVLAFMRTTDLEWVKAMYVIEAGEHIPTEDEAPLEDAVEAEAQPTRKSETVTLICIINGQESPAKVSTIETVATARDMALRYSQNVCRPPSDWQVRTEGGVLIEPETLVSALNIEHGVMRLFLSLEIGAGGET